MGNRQPASGSTQGKDQLDGGTSADNAKLIRFFNNTAGKSGELSQDNFKTLFGPCAEYGSLLFEHLKKNNDSPTDQPLTVTEFVPQCSPILELLTLSQKLELYFSVFSKGTGTLSKDGFQKMLQTSYYLTWEYTSLGTCSEPDGSILQNCVNNVFREDETVTSSRLSSWPLAPLLEGIHLYTAALLSSDITTAQAEAGAKHKLIQEISERHTLLSPTLLWLLSSSLPAVFLPSCSTVVKGDANLETDSKHSNLACAAEQWHCLYNSEDQGLSLNRFEHHVFAYKGPTLLLVTFESFLYCIAVDEEWRESSTRWGGTNSQLYQLQPQCKVVQGGPGLMFMNIRDRTLPKCLGFEKNGRMTIDGEFAKVKHYGVDYKLHSVEVWGCGGREMLTQQQEQKNWEKREAEKQKNRKLKLEDWKDNPDRLILQMGGIETQHEHTDQGNS